MRLGTADGEWLWLGLKGYQFADADDPHKRCSWHVVEGEASSVEGAWTFVWQALTCSESEQFTGWLRMAAAWLDDEVSLPYWVPAGTDFTEPNVSFSVNRRRDGGGLIVARLDTEFRPPWRAPSGTAGNAVLLHIAVEGSELRRAADDWADDVGRWPNRA
ncbi:MAG TPA: hypothetical protein VFX13_00535 [Gaiellales bacterium]|nr:hypothetical protein [Gaiellales bacterium]